MFPSRLLLAVSVAAALALAGGPASARGGKGAGGSTASNNPSEHNVRGYTKKDGTRVEPHHATDPNKSKRDNYSSKGNANPHTGKAGTKDPDKP